MKVITIIALTAVISIPSSSFAWGRGTGLLSFGLSFPALPLEEIFAASRLDFFQIGP